MDNKHKTAVEWIFLMLNNPNRNQEFAHKLLDKAKEMEKEIIETAYNKGTVNGIDYPLGSLPLTGEQYYEQTYGGGEQ